MYFRTNGQIRRVGLTKVEVRFNTSGGFRRGRGRSLPAQAGWGCAASLAYESRERLDGRIAERGGKLFERHTRVGAQRFSDVDQNDFPLEFAKGGALHVAHGFF